MHIMSKDKHARTTYGVRQKTQRFEHVEQERGEKASEGDPKKIAAAHAFLDCS